MGRLTEKAGHLPREDARVSFPNNLRSRWGLTERKGVGAGPHRRRRRPGRSGSVCCQPVV